MRAVTHEEIQQSIECIEEMSEKDSRQFLIEMSEEQPYIQIYVAAILERGDFTDEDDSDIFTNLVMITWHAMRQASGGNLGMVLGKDIEEFEDKILELYDYAQDEPDEDWPELIHAWTERYNQRPLLEFILQSLMSPHSQYCVSPNASGMIFTYLKVIVDSVDNAKING